ncbi:alkaline phosphatase family protein [uncultured Jatrophihabitans sp.]|uniref:alkaline phosphatase family protein n=1 Tax=uncultured Jatrophihabitans sp. TaxID=1610747 RepID=UPI0035CC6BC0
MAGLSRRDFLKFGSLAGMVAAGAPVAGLLDGGPAGAATVRKPNSLPHPSRPAGTVDPSLPYDHIVVVMMENHSFDNYLGALSRHGQPKADGLHFSSSGVALNSNPGPHGAVRAYPFADTAQGSGVTQTWNSTHEQVNGGKMNGFVKAVGNSAQAMGYWGPDQLPFAYSFAKTFTTANRWFCSAPCQTYPNRRFLMAGTAYGDIATASSTITLTPPPNGTIFDRLHAHGISWKNYYTDLPQTAIIPSIVSKYPGNLSPIQQFIVDCAAGTLPSVSFVDPEFGVVSEIGAPLVGVPGVTPIGSQLSQIGGDEEEPQDLAYGETWAWAIVRAVLASPAWQRTLLIYTYDEHGGYYDHVPPPAAIAPDSIKPDLTATDVKGGYTVYGPRVPAIIASPYAKPNAVTNIVHDHTSVLATIEAKWNLPALTYRDANAATVADFLDVKHAAFRTPPRIAPPKHLVPEVLADLTAGL